MCFPAGKVCIWASLQFKASSVHLLSSCVGRMGTSGGSDPFCEREQGRVRLQRAADQRHFPAAGDWVRWCSSELGFSSRAHTSVLEWFANDLIRSLVCHWLMDPTFCWPEPYENSPLPLLVCPKINHPLRSKCVLYFSVSGFAFQAQTVTMPFSAVWKGLFTWGVFTGWRYFYFFLSTCLNTFW